MQELGHLSCPTVLYGCGETNLVRGVLLLLFRQGALYTSTEARDQRKCDIHINSNPLVLYLVNHDISIKIDGAVVNEFDEG